MSVNRKKDKMNDNKYYIYNMKDTNPLLILNTVQIFPILLKYAWAYTFELIVK